jgi:hypothetical protein
MHVARQRVFAAPRTLGAAKSVRFKNKKAIVLDLEFVLKKG